MTEVRRRRGRLSPQERAEKRRRFHLDRIDSAKTEAKRLAYTVGYLLSMFGRVPTPTADEVAREVRQSVLLAVSRLEQEEEAAW